MGQGDIVDDALISLLAILGVIFLVLLVFEIAKFMYAELGGEDQMPLPAKFSYEERIGKPVLAQKEFYSKGNGTAHCRYTRGELTCLMS